MEQQNAVFPLVLLNQGGPPHLPFSNVVVITRVCTVVFPKVLWFCCGVQFLGKLGPQASSCRLVYTEEQ